MNKITIENKDYDIDSFEAVKLTVNKPVWNENGPSVVNKSVRGLIIKIPDLVLLQPCDIIDIKIEEIGQYKWIYDLECAAVKYTNQGTKITLHETDRTRMTVTL